MCRYANFRCADNFLIECFFSEPELNELRNYQNFKILKKTFNSGSDKHLHI